LTIAKATTDDAGSYSCRFDKINARMEVNVVSAEEAKYYSKQISHHSSEPIHPAKSTLFNSLEEHGEMEESEDFIDPTDPDTRRISTEASNGAYFDSFKFFSITSTAPKSIHISTTVSFLLISFVYCVISG